MTNAPALLDGPLTGPQGPASRLWAGLLRRCGGYGLLGFLLLTLGLLMLYPIILIVSAGFVRVAAVPGHGHAAKVYSFSPDFFANVLGNPAFRANLANSLLLALVVTFLANLIALPLAVLQQRYSFRGKGFLSALVLVPLVLPPFVGAIGMKQLLGKFGALTMICQDLHLLRRDEGINWLRAGGGSGGFWACALLITLGLYPIAYLNLQAALANIDPALREAAENLGSRRFTIFRRITLPLAMPGIFAGSTIIFIWAFTELGTPLLLDYSHVVSRDLFDSLSSASGGSDAEAAAKVAIVLVIAAMAFLVGKFLFGRRAWAMTSKAAVAATTQPLSRRGTLLVILPFLAVSFLAMLPHLGVVLYSFTPIATEPGVGWGAAGHFGWYRSIIPSRYTLAGYANVINTPEIYGSILNSIKYAAISTGIDLVLGIAIAWVHIRTKLWGRSALDAMAMLPLAVPGLVMAFGYVWMSLLWPFPHTADGKPYSVLNPFLFLVIAYSVRRLPYLVRSAAGGLQQTSVTLEEAAANLGANPLRVLWKVTLPLIMANLIAGALLTFSFAMLEVSDSLILAQTPQFYPITKMIYALGSDTSAADNMRNACALGVLAMLLLAGSILTAGALMGKRLGAIFRA
jgi:iron(III) transport system permease protein